MIYLGIDQSYSGLAMSAWDAETGEDFTVVKGFDPKKYGSGAARLVEIHGHITSHLYRLTHGFPFNIAHVCMEGYAAGAKFGREVAGELGAVVKMALLTTLSNYPHEGPRVKYPTIVAPTALKKYVLGKGNGGKNEMLLGVYKKWGAEFTDDNAADAYALARLAHAAHTDTTGFAYEREVLSALRLHTEEFTP